MSPGFDVAARCIFDNAELLAGCARYRPAARLLFEPLDPIRPPRARVLCRRFDPIFERRRLVAVGPVLILDLVWRIDDAGNVARPSEDEFDGARKHQ